MRLRRPTSGVYGYIHAPYPTLQRRQRNSVLPVRNQRPPRGAVIAQPVMLNAPLQFPRSNERRRGTFSRFGHPFGLDQE
jgi:hypothetical protein